MRRLAQAVLVLATAVAVVSMHALGTGHTPVGHSSAHASAHSSAHASAHSSGHSSAPSSLPVVAMAALAVATQVDGPIGEGDHGMAQMCLAVLTLMLALALLGRHLGKRVVDAAVYSWRTSLAAPGRSPPHHLRPSLHRLCVSRT